MSELQVTRSSISQDLEDDFITPYFSWPRVERTCAPISGPVEEAAQLRFHHPARTFVQWHEFRTLAVVDRFMVGSVVLHLDDENFPVELQRMLTESVGDLLSLTGRSDDLGAPKIDVLLEAVENLTAWTAMTKQALSKYVGISYSTVLSWRRERPSRPRHRNIPTLLTLWSAVSGAQEEFGVEDAARMVWAAGKTDTGMPAIPASELATWLVQETSEASLADFLTDDGYVAGTAPVPDVQELAEAEGRLHTALEAPRAESDDTAGR